MCDFILNLFGYDMIGILIEKYFIIVTTFSSYFFLLLSFFARLSALCRNLLELFFFLSIDALMFILYVASALTVVSTHVDLCIKHYVVVVHLMGDTRVPDPCEWL